MEQTPVEQTHDIKAKVAAVIEKIRPYIQSDGGDISLVAVDQATGVVEVRLHGACGSCPSSIVTLKAGVERMLRTEVPGITEVVSV